MKILHARLKNDIEATQEIGGLDWEKAPLHAATLVERSKQQILVAIKAKLHEKITTLSLEDIAFKIE